MCWRKIQFIAAFLLCSKVLGDFYPSTQGMLETLEEQKERKNFFRVFAFLA
jgi:hypothetical protein